MDEQLKASRRDAQGRGLAWITSASAMIANVQLARQVMSNDGKFFAVVKANAYGYGLEGVVRALAPVVDGFAVGSIQDAKSIRRWAPDRSILVHPSPLTDSSDPSGIILTAWDHGSLDALLHEPRAGIAVKVDVGFGRLGFSPEQVSAALQAIGSAGRSCDVLYSHLSFPIGDPARTRDEFDKFMALLAALRHSGHEIGTAMCASTSVLMHYPEMCLDAVNCGQLVYGLPYTPRMRELFRPITTELSGQIIQVRRFRAGERIGYGVGTTLARDTIAAVVSAGWADGYPVYAQRTGGAIVDDRLAPLLYEPTLEYCVLDVTEARCKVDDRAWFVGGPVSTPITWAQAAAWAGKSELQLAVELRTYCQVAD